MSRIGRLRRALAGRWPWRLLLVGAAIKLPIAGLRLMAGSVPALIEAIDTIGSIFIVVALAYVVYRLGVRAKRRLLWRVRRKLILSYIFIGVVPALLIVTFFVVSGLMLFLNVGSYLVRNALGEVTGQARALAEMTLRELERGTGPSAVGAAFAERRGSLESRFPGAAMAVVPTTSGEPCAGSAVQPQGTAAGPARGAIVTVAPLAVGPWAHVEPPRILPGWVKCTGFAGVLAVNLGPGTAGKEPAGPPIDDEILIVVRAVALPTGGRPRYAVVIDIPVDAAVKAQLREATGVRPGRVSAVLLAGVASALPMPGKRAGRPAGDAGMTPRPLSDTPVTNPWTWVAPFGFTDWTTGRSGDTLMSIEVNIADIYDRLSVGQGRSGLNAGRFFLVFLFVVAVLFLIIEFAALVMGLVLARSITGSIHQLFTGTERARQGDFEHKIAVGTRDQLGELAESFNLMTGSIVDLMRQAEEKRRLEEELRIARVIQMSLLPQGPLSIPGLSITALCVPAREVGGDYYDVFPLDGRRLGVLIADVSGKGTSAAFYMAELKGLMLSLTGIHRSPRDLLIHANRIISNHLDSRSFITMIYAVIDLEAQTMSYARAGHTPLIVRTDGAGPRPTVQVLAPEGMVLGVRIDQGELFERLLEEDTILLRQGDLLMFYTDGLSEAMNAGTDFFGEPRLAHLVEEHGDLPSDELQERILSEIQSFVGDAPQHDDMTMILLQVERAAPWRCHERGATAAA